MGGPPEYVEKLAVSPNGRYLVTGGRLGRVSLWDLVAGSKIASFIGHRQELKGPARLVFALASGELNNHLVQIAITPDGTKAISADLDGMIIVWDLETHKKIREFDQGIAISEIAISPDSELLYASAVTLGPDFGGDGKPGELIAWNIKTGKKSRLFDHKSKASVVSLVVSKDGQRLFGGLNDGSILIWDTATAKLTDKRHPHNDRVVSLLLGGDGNQLLTVSRDKSIELWSATDLVWIRSFGEKVVDPTSAAISADGMLLLVSALSPDNALSIWELGSDKKRSTIKSAFGVRPCG